ARQRMWGSPGHARNASSASGRNPDVFFAFAKASRSRWSHSSDASGASPKGKVICRKDAGGIVTLYFQIRAAPRIGSESHQQATDAHGRIKALRESDNRNVPGRSSCSASAGYGLQRRSSAGKELSDNAFIALKRCSQLRFQTMDMPVVTSGGARIPVIGLGTWDLRGRTCARV